MIFHISIQAAILILSILPSDRKLSDKTVLRKSEICFFLCVVKISSDLAVKEEENIAPHYDQCILFKQMRPRKSVSLTSMRQVKAGLHFLWGAGWGSAGGWEIHPKRRKQCCEEEMNEARVLATQREDSHLRTHAAKKLILSPPLLQGENFVSHLCVCLFVMHRFNHIHSSFLSLHSAFPSQSSVISLPSRDISGS